MNRPARPSAGEILERVVEDAESEIERPSAALAFSGFAAGLTMGLTGIGVAALQAAHAPEGIAYLLYPVGFVAVIMGRAQLFTENTLYPVVLVLDRRQGLTGTLRLWSVVLAANVLGVVVFAAIVAETSALPGTIEPHLVELGVKAAAPAWTHVFWSGVIGGWLIALVAWLVEGAARAIAQVVLIWLLTFLVGIGHFAHCIATSAEILTAVVHGSLGVGTYAGWLAAATLGNVAGGVVVVALLNYGQVMAGREA